MVRRHEEEVDLKDDAATTPSRTQPRKRPTTRMIHEDLGERPERP
jgi:hypothetical protein